MKNLYKILLAIVFLATGFIAGFSYSHFSTRQKLEVDKERLNFLLELHDFQRNNSRKVHVASDTILNKILRFNEDGSLWAKGKTSDDPLKKLLSESYDCIGRNVDVIRNYDRQVYPEDSAFLKTYFKLEE